jgi:hypothetical protein
MKKKLYAVCVIRNGLSSGNLAIDDCPYGTFTKVQERKKVNLSRIYLQYVRDVMCVRCAWCVRTTPGGITVSLHPMRPRTEPPLSACHHSDIQSKGHHHATCTQAGGIAERSIGLLIPKANVLLLTAKTKKAPGGVWDLAIQNACTTHAFPLLATVPTTSPPV